MQFHFDFRIGSIVIGRDAKTCQIVIPSSSVSRQHARLSRVDGQYFIEDLKSQNRTYLNEVEIHERTPIRIGDAIKLGEHVIHFPGDTSLRPAMPPLAKPPAGLIAGAQWAPDYMAPEQIRDEALSEATDLHAVGVILFQMLTGELPFEAGVKFEGAKLEAIAKKQFASCVDRCRKKGIKSNLAKLVDRCLARGYLHARHLLQDLGPLPNPTSPKKPNDTEHFWVVGFLFEDRLTETFTAVGAVSGAVVNLRLIKPSYDNSYFQNLLAGASPIPADAPVAYLRRYRVGRGYPVPVQVDGPFFINPLTAEQGCLALVEEYAGSSTLMQAISRGSFLRNDDAITQAACSLLAGLEFAHSRGELHTRLNPYCIFVQPGGSIKVEGFGGHAESANLSGRDFTLGLLAEVEAQSFAHGGESHSAMSTIGGHRLVGTASNLSAERYWAAPSPDAETLQPPTTDGIPQLEPIAPDADEFATIESTIDSQHFGDQPVDKLRALLEISSKLSRGLELDSVLAAVGDILFDVFRSADRCFVILQEDGVLKTKVMKSRRNTGKASSFSRSVVRKAIDERAAFLSADASQYDSTELRKSIADVQILSIMCVPLATVDGQALGAIQIDTTNVAKRFSQDDLMLLTGVAQQVSLAIERGILYESSVAIDRQHREMQIAGEVQRGLLPQRLPEVKGYDFYSHYSAADHVGGDYYDFIAMPNGRTIVALGDVVGRGVAAALLMASLRSEARFTLLAELDLGRAMNRLNDQMIANGPADRFVTLLVAEIDPVTHLVTVANAGHLTPFVYSKRLNIVKEAAPDKQTGLPIGVAPGFHYETSSLTLEPGDVIVLYTDGITELMDGDGNAFGHRRLLHAIAGAASMPVKAIGERIMQEIHGFGGDRRQNDDIALVCFGRREESI